MTNLLDTFLWRVAIIAGIIVALIMVAMLARAIRALRHKNRIRDRHGSQTPLAPIREPVPDVVELAPPRHSSPARRPAAGEIAQNDIFRDAA
jgi:hypothetical protein